MDHPILQSSRPLSLHAQRLSWRGPLCVLGCLVVLMWACDLQADSSSEAKPQAASTANQKHDDLNAEAQFDDATMNAQDDEVESGKEGKRRPGNAQGKPQRNEQAAGRQGKRENHATELQEEDMPAALAVLHDYRPELVKRFQDWAERHPENARITLSRSVPMMTRLVRMRQDDPEGYRLAIEDLRAYRFTSELSKQLQQAKTDKDQPRVEELSSKLRALLARHFEVRQEIREREVQKLQDRIDQLRTQMDRRLEKREQILKLRFEQLSDPDEKTPW